MSYTNYTVANMKPAAIAAAFGLASNQNGWHYRETARVACDAGQSEAEFQPRKRREVSQSTDTAGQPQAKQTVLGKAAKAATPLMVLDAKTAAVAQLLAVSRGVSFSAATLRNILEASSQLPELAFLDAGQLASLRNWAGCKSRDERVAEFISNQVKAIYSVDQNRRMAMSLIQHGYQVAIPEAVESILSMSYASSVATAAGQMDLPTAAQVEQLNRNLIYGFADGFDGHLAGCFI